MVECPTWFKISLLVLVLASSFLYQYRQYRLCLTPIDIMWLISYRVPQNPYDILVYIKIGKFLKPWWREVPMCSHQLIRCVCVVWY